MISANILRGAVYEAEFQTEALRRGFIPHVPCTTVGWDYVVSCPRGLLKVQVKGTQTPVPHYKEAYKVTTSSGTGSKNRIGAEIDVIACWVDPLRVWYLIPTDVRIPKTIALYAGVKRSSSKFQTYREDWSPFYNH